MTMAAASGVEFWQKETTLYDTPHLRLRIMARWLRQLPQRRLLDLGCSTARLRNLLPADYRYFGCDISDHARSRLSPGHFLQMDLNQTGDFSAFAHHGIDVIHIGGVLEYLQRPRLVLRALRNLVTGNSPMVLSVINFDSRRYAEADGHHPGWVFKATPGRIPRLARRRGLGGGAHAPLFGQKGFRQLVVPVLDETARSGRSLDLQADAAVHPACASPLNRRAAC
jgi:SAM-dependent methyltransferase